MPIFIAMLLRLIKKLILLISHYSNMNNYLKIDRAPNPAGFKHSSKGYPKMNKTN